MDTRRFEQGRRTLMCIAGAVVGPVILAGQTAAQTVDFSREIRPLLSDRCFICHGPDEAARQAGLRLDDPDSLQAGANPVIIPGRSSDSEVVRRIRSQDPAERMPPQDSGRSLSQAEQDLIARWIDQGAKSEVHWAYRPPVRLPLPEVMNGSAAIDELIAAKFPADVHPAPEADRTTLIRRLHFDLVGLPPSWEDVQRFLSDSSPDAVERLVDRLLASPHFGERLALYWLDVVRFADSNGYHSDEPRQLGPYREYVIRAFNRNLPYDQFVIEQLAGDLLPEATMDQQVASGFNMLLQTTTEGGAQEKEYIAKYAADRVRNTSQIFLGSTLGCCECHNHKFDPFTIQDFYSFAAFFADIDQPVLANPVAYPVYSDAHRAALAEFDQKIARLRSVLETSTPELEQAQRQWEASWGSASTGVVQSPWFRLGPVAGDSFENARAIQPVDPAAVDTAAEVNGLRWVESPDSDGIVHHFNPDANSVIYLTRVITVPEAQEVELRLGSDDALTVWLNGRQVHDNAAQRAAAPDQDILKVALQAGDNRLLLKVVNGGGGFGYYYHANLPALPDSVRAAMQVAESDRTESQRNELAAYFRSITPLLQPVREELRHAEAARKAYDESVPRSLMTRTRTPRDVKLLHRGNWMDESGPVMAPAVPAFLGRLETGERRANRLDLARWITSRDNPLTARTMVNRLWKIYFGEGLATPLDDLGRQGVLPSHPELLDWLAVEFMDSGWDLKHMIRMMVLSQSYRRQSIVPESERAADPANKWFARQTRFRLEAELVRDNALAISRLLNPELGGPSVYPYQPAGYWRHLNFPQREWPGDSGSDLYRRGIYTWWQRMFMHPSLKAFDAPSREECTVERPRSNIPQQALVLLNDPIYVEAARAFGERIVLYGGASDSERIRWAFEQAVSRPAGSEETQILTDVCESFRSAFAANPESAAALLSVGEYRAAESIPRTELAAWTAVARVILNLSETITRP